MYVSWGWFCSTLLSSGKGGGIAVEKFGGECEVSTNRKFVFVLAGGGMRSGGCRLEEMDGAEK